MAFNPTGEIDTLNLLFEKLDSLLNESQGYYESFLDINNMYKQGQISDREFFQKLGDYVVAYSALEFLAIKVMFEVRKVLPKRGTTQSPGLMSGMGQPGMGSAGMGQPGMPPDMRVGTSANPVGAPPGIVSAEAGFSQPGTLPTPDPTLVPRDQRTKCASCGQALRPNAKFCTSCGTRV